MQGFRAKYKSVYSPETKVKEVASDEKNIDKNETLTLETRYIQCDETIFVEDKKIQIASENYPNLYYSNFNCQTFITAKSKRRLNITFTEVSMEPCCDYIDVIEEPSKKRLAKLNQESLQESLSYIPMSNSISIRMVSDHSVNLKGFLATVEILPEEDCYKTLVIPINGNIKLASQSYPSKYPRRNCTWKIISEDPNLQIRIKFDEI